MTLQQQPCLSLQSAKKAQALHSPVCTLMTQKQGSDIRNQKQGRLPSFCLPADCQALRSCPEAGWDGCLGKRGQAPLRQPA